jgi:hypothetical protein
VGANAKTVEIATETPFEKISEQESIIKIATER